MSPCGVVVYVECATYANDCHWSFLLFSAVALETHLDFVLQTFFRCPTPLQLQVLAGSALSLVKLVSQESVLPPLTCTDYIYLQLCFWIHLSTDSSHLVSLLTPSVLFPGHACNACLLFMYSSTSTYYNKQVHVSGLSLGSQSQESVSLGFAVLTIQMKLSKTKLRPCYVLLWGNKILMLKISCIVDSRSRDSESPGYMLLQIAYPLCTLSFCLKEITGPGRIERKVTGM